MRWKSIYWRKILNRNAPSRRDHLAKSIRRESQRKARGDAELEAILQAQKQKEEVQANQRRRSQARIECVSQTRNGQPNPSLAGLKRKSLHGDDLSPVTNNNNPRKVAKSQTARRPKVMEGGSAISRASPFSKPGASPSPPRLGSASLLGRSPLIDRDVRTSVRRSTAGRKIDYTRTDYFRLKALGVDPDTPIFPDTKSSLERRRRRQEGFSHVTPRKRASTMSSVKVRTSDWDGATPSINLQAPINITPTKTSIPVSRENSSVAIGRLIDDDEDFLRQIREVRAAMSEDTEWFRTQAAQIQSEVEQEELKRSASQKSSMHSNDTAMAGLNGGLSRVNGYGYAPSIPQSGSQLSLSRTEQRIRATGAHGLATKPVSEYLAVAMSKSTRAALLNGKVPGRATKRKGKVKHSEKDSKYVYESDEDIEEDGLEIEDALTGKRIRQNSQKRHARASSNTFEASEGRSIIEDVNGDGAAAVAYAEFNQHKALEFDEDLYDEESGEKVVEEEEFSEDREVVVVEGVVEEEEEYVYPTNNGTGEGDEGEDEAEDEAEEYDEDDDDDGSFVDENLLEAGGSNTWSNLRGGQGEQRSAKANPFHMRLRSATPESHTSPDQVFTPGGTHMSRATSGTGVSADDALVLSD